MNTILISPTSDINKSIDFYTKLGFRHIIVNSKIYFTDGKVIVEINEDRFARAGVKLFRSSWSNVVEKLQAKTDVIKISDGYLLSDRTGVWIYLMEKETEVLSIVAGECFSELGEFAGLSIEGITIASASEIWREIGFEVTMGGVDQPWMSAENEDGLGISFMAANTCPHLFFNPSMTYFNGTKNLEIIKKIRNLGIPFVEEITHFNKEGIVDNVLLRDPGGFGFFVFSD